MKVLFLLPRFHTNLFHGVKALQDAGHTVTIYAPATFATEDHSFVVPELLPRNISWSGIWRRLKQLRPDIIVIREHRGAWRRFLWLARALGIKCVGYELRPHHKPRGTIKRLRELWDGKPWRRFAPVRGFDHSRSNHRDFYLPLPVAAPTANHARGHRLRILCVGKLKQERKRHMVLLDALEQISTLPFTVTFIGSLTERINGASDAYYQKLLARMTHEPLAERIRVMPERGFLAMAELYSDHDICVLPARREPLGMSPLEGMSYGCVPVISDDCGAASVIENGTSGFVFPVDDAAALAGIIRQLIEQPALWCEASRAAQAYAAFELSGDTFAKRFAEMVAAL